MRAAVRDGAARRASRTSARARCGSSDDPIERRGRVLIVSAGTSDGPVVHEARIRAELLGTRRDGARGRRRRRAAPPRSGDPRSRSRRRRRRGRGHGRRARERDRRARGLPRDRRADERRLRLGARRPDRAQRDARVRAPTGSRSSGSTTASAPDRSPRGSRAAPRFAPRDPGRATSIRSGGLAGDMLLAALLDAGAPRAALDDTVARARPRRRRDRGRAAGAARGSSPPTSTSGTADAPADAPPRRLRALIERGRPLPDRVRERSLEALDRLVAAEAAVHGVARERGRPARARRRRHAGRHLRRVRAARALGDRAARRASRCRSVAASRRRDHGPMPLPAPGHAGAPRRCCRSSGSRPPGELVTPTGAAIVARAADAFGRAARDDARGRRRTGPARASIADRPNVVRVRDRATRRRPAPPGAARSSLLAGQRRRPPPRARARRARGVPRRPARSTCGPRRSR